MLDRKNEYLSDKEVAQMMVTRILRINLSNIEIDKLNLTYNQKSVLNRLMLASEDGSEITVTDLSIQMDITKSAISQTISKLERKGLIKRSWAKGDRRRILVNLTAKGSAFTDNLNAGMIEFIRQKLGRLQEEEKNIFVNTFIKCTDTDPGGQDEG